MTHVLIFGAQGRLSQQLLEFVAGKIFEDYANDRLLRSAVERQFEIIGEALNQLCKWSRRADRIPDVP